jgi:chromosome partitioning protein
MKIVVTAEGRRFAPEALGLAFPVRMHERVIYAETFAHGKTAPEIDAKGIAAAEAAALWSAVKTRILESDNS